MTFEKWWETQDPKMTLGRGFHQVAQQAWHAALQWAWAPKQSQEPPAIPESPSVDLSQEEPPDPHALVFSYEEILAAWVAGRHNFRLYGDTGYDAPDFATWLKERNKPR